MIDEQQANLIALTADIAAAFVANNSIGPDAVPELISTIYRALAATARGEADQPPAVYEPAVSVRKSLAKRDHILSLIDGKPYKMLKRHLSHHGLTPESYRARYKLRADYPMVAPAYSDLRSEAARRMNLGGGARRRSKSRSKAG